MNKTIKFDCELTDTFGGEANYSWVKRKTITLPENATPRQIVIAAKEALELTGVRCTKWDNGDVVELRPVGMCQVAFIVFHETTRTVVGTSYFPTRVCAYSYYKREGCNFADVDQKIERQEITIGRPELKEGETLEEIDFRWHKIIES